MKINKQLNKMIDNLLKTTFEDDGRLNQALVEGHVNTLKSLPIPDSVFALGEYLRRVKYELARTTLEIEAAVPLTPAQVKCITEAIKADHYVSAVKTIINTSILGGLRVKIGDVVYDDSVARRILQLGEDICQI